MKKILLLASVVALGFSSCNSDSDPRGVVFGSLESKTFGVNVVVRNDGTIFETEPGYQKLPEIETGLDRQFSYVVFDYLEENSQQGPGKIFKIRPVGWALFPTNYPVRENDESYDDPIISFAHNNEKELIETSCNYLVMYTYAELYKKNATGEESVAKWDYEVKIDPTLVPGEKGDTINMYLSFSANAAQDEAPLSQYGATYLTVDLKDVDDPMINGFDRTKKYIIKLNYKGYKINSFYNDMIDFDKNTVLDKFVACEWDPSWKSTIY